MTTKLKIDLSQGILEVEGSESFVRTIYKDFKIHFAGIEALEEEPKSARRSRRRKKAVAVAPQPTPQAVEPAPESVSPVVTPEPKPKRTAPPAPTYAYLKDLNLGAADDRASLVEFMDSKFPITNEERNVVFLYYMQYQLKIKPITIDHIYTCYREAKIRAPLNLENSLRTTADQKKWMRTAKNGHMNLTAVGKRYVEKELPKKVKS